MSTLRTGIAGFGFIAEQGHLHAYQDGTSRFHVAAVADPCVARWPAIGRLLPHARIYEDAKTMLAKEPLDVLDVCAPPSEHASLALAGFARGLHVICEKPLTITRDESHGLAEAARDAKRVLYPSHSYRFAPVIRAAHDVLRGGLVGAPKLASVATYRTGNARGVSEWRPDWRREHALAGGGILMDHGPHTFYVAFDWFDAYPVSVSARVRTLGGGEVDDDVSVTLRFPGDRLLHVHLTWNAGFRKVIYTVHGDRGGLRIEDDQLEVTRRMPDGRYDATESELASHWKDAGHGAWFVELFAAFGRAIDQRDYVGREAQDSIRAIEVIEAAYVSSREGGKAISLSDISPRRIAA
ncbi:Gfo/Idh/MocA family oxidoreductase [soil metagenome]